MRSPRARLLARRIPAARRAGLPARPRRRLAPPRRGFAGCAARRCARGASRRRRISSSSLSVGARPRPPRRRLPASARHEARDLRREVVELRDDLAERSGLHEDPPRPRVARGVHGRALHVEARAGAELREGAEHDEVAPAARPASIAFASSEVATAGPGTRTTETPPDCSSRAEIISASPAER